MNKQLYVGRDAVYSIPNRPLTPTDIEAINFRLNPLSDLKELGKNPVDNEIKLERVL